LHTRRFHSFIFYSFMRILLISRNNLTIYGRIWALLYIRLSMILLDTINRILQLFLFVHHLHTDIIIVLIHLVVIIIIFRILIVYINCNFPILYSRPNFFSYFIFVLQFIHLLLTIILIHSHNFIISYCIYHSISSRFNTTLQSLPNTYIFYRIGILD